MASSSEEQHVLQRVRQSFGGASDTHLSLLSLDGGGVRGLSSLYILSNIMTKINAERENRNENAVKPCQVFDLIGGTSTGG
jgi:patatin-like phospholipase/acyl hydrolase